MLDNNLMGYTAIISVMLFIDGARLHIEENMVTEEDVYVVEKVKNKRCKVFCPHCGHKLFRASRFDLEMDCPNCGSSLELEREDFSIRISLEFNFSED